MEIAEVQENADVLVIGGGLVGLATSLELAERGAKVTCLEASHFGAQQSAQNWGFVRKQGRALAEIPLMLDAINRWSSLSDRLGRDVGWVQGGNLAIFSTVSEESNYRNWLASVSSFGIDSKVIGQKEITQIIPRWKRGVRGALFSPSDGHSEPSAVIEAYLFACRQAGVQLVQKAEVSRLLTRGSEVVGAKVGPHIFQAKVTVLATGSSTRKILGTIDVDFPQSYVTGTVSLTTPAEPITTSTVWGNGFSFRQRQDGRIVCTVGGGGVVRLGPDVVAQAPLFMGAFKKNWKRFAIKPTSSLVSELPQLLRGKAGLRSIGAPMASVRRSESVRALQKLQGTLAGLEDIRVEHAWAGVIDATPDGNPVIDGSPGPEGLILAAGFSGHGYGLVPTVGHIVADLVAGTGTNFDLQPFRLCRFATQDFKTPDSVL
jgi:glycine/D-amino acid oxidase-like deaminating enzyme